jgi:hypothetical protein
MAITWNTPATPAPTSGGINWNTPNVTTAKPDSFHSLALGRVVAPGTGSTPNFGAVLSNIGKLPGEISSMAEASLAAGLGKAVGNSIYSLGSAAGSALTGNLPAAEKTLAEGSKTTTSQFESGSGSAIQSAALPVSLMLGGGADAIGGAGDALAATGKPILSGLGDSLSSLATKLAPSWLGRTAAAAATYGTVGGVLGGSNAMANNASAGDVASAAGTGALTGAAGGVVAQGASEAIDATLQGSNTASATLMNKVARINPSAAENFSHMSGGVTPGEFLDQRGIYGNAPSVTAQLFNRFTQSKNAVDTALEKLPGLYQNKAVDTALSDIIEQAKATSAEGAPSPYLTQAQALLGKSQSGGLNMTEVNQVKRLFEGTVKLNYIKDGVSTGIERANNIDSAIRTWQQQTAYKLGFTNIKDLNKETQLSKMLIDEIGKKANAQLGNNIVGLTDWIVASHIPGDPSSLALLLGKHLFGSGTGQGFLAKLMSSGEKFAAPSAELGAMNTNPAQLGLPGAGETSNASNLPPVIHASTSKLNPADKIGVVPKR